MMKKTGYIFGLLASLLWIYMGFINIFISDIANAIIVVTGCVAFFMNGYLFLDKKNRHWKQILKIFDKVFKIAYT